MRVVLYFAQEDEKSGVYYIDAEPTNNEITALDKIKGNGGYINGESTEGLAILNHEKGKLLIASSQGSSDFDVI